MKLLLFVFISFIFISFNLSNAYASSSYVLPYPGIMPGNKLYMVSDFIDTFKGFFAFGDFASFSYNLSQADKYLIEAKTLFEYKQYLLARDSLEDSNVSIKKAKNSLELARKHKKSVAEKTKVFQDAISKHNEVLTSLLEILPADFLWEDEKKAPVKIFIKDDILRAISIRNSL